MVKRFVALAAFAVLVALPASAYAGGWKTSISPMGSDPHGGYVQTSRKCGVCHAVHEAYDASSTAGELLLRSTVANACSYCHLGGPFAAIQVYGGDPQLTTSTAGVEHTLSSANATIPDSGDTTGQANPANDIVLADGLGCLTCHSVHGANTVGSGVNILRVRPNPSVAGTATSETEFCSACHTNNLVREHDLGYWAGTAVIDQSSHYMGAVTSSTIATGTDPFNDYGASTECRYCHKGGDGTPMNDYPHLTTGRAFLKDSYDLTGTDRMDSVCLDCHSRIGIDF